MRIIWNEQSIRWFHNASEYTDYNKKLAELLLDQIPCRKTLCDLGCGAGLIDFELAPYFEHITCVDISREAAQSVEAHAACLGINNISACCMDADKLRGEWDTVLALFHGGTEIFSRYFHLAGDRLILATHGDKKGNFGPEKHKVDKCFDVSGVKARLDALGVRYSLREITLEYGQPFTDLPDAEAFVRAYSTPMNKSELDSYLAQRLEKTGNEKFPYYLPNQKKIGTFLIRRDENENI